MAKPEWGQKRTCQSCGAPFYDLHKNPIICPKCGAEFRPETVLKSRRPAPVADKAPKPAEKEKAEDKADEDDVLIDNDEDDDVSVEDDDNDSLMEDTSDLDENDDDIAVDAPASDGDDTEN